MSKVNIDIGCKIHNRFDIEIKDIRTGEITQRGKAENIILNALFSSVSGLMSSATSNYSWLRKIAYGDGEGDLSPTRSSLFNLLGKKTVTDVSSSKKQPPAVSERKVKIVILPQDEIGKVITEVGICGRDFDTLYTHAILQDAEGNALEMKPKTEFQEITIFATIFATMTIPEGIMLMFDTSNQAFLNVLLGLPFSEFYYHYAQSNAKLAASSSKEETVTTKNYNNLLVLGTCSQCGFSTFVSSGIRKTPRIRFAAAVGNGKIWSLIYWKHTATGSTSSGFRILFPNSMWPGYHFEDKAIGIANGQQTKFVLPWSDINTDKQYKFYVDNALQTENVDYTLSNSENETSITFVNPPDDEAQITGDWWVDYIPKDEDHVLDLEFSITFGEGV